MLLNYTRKQGEKIKEYVLEGILYAGVDWSLLVKPQGNINLIFEIRQHCYHILLDLVIVHATINEVSKSLLRSVFFGLVELLAQELLITFRMVDRFGSIGMLQVFKI